MGSVGFRTMRDAHRIVANLFRQRDLSIGVRLTAGFLAVVGLMIAADAVALWQLHQLAAHTE